MTLYEEYISGWEDFESELLIFDEHTRKKILNKLKKEKNKVNFLSRITEVNFGLFYAQNGAIMEYEKKYQLKNKKQEPDWTITLNDQTFINEVLRLNPTKKDQDRNGFEEQLTDQIRQIEGNYYLQINYQNEYFQATDYNLDFIIKKLTLWFSEKRSLSDQITLFDNFTFTIVNVNSEQNTILPAGNYNSIDIDKRRLESINSEFHKKINKYVELIEQTKIPFVISLYSDFTNGIDVDDVFSFLYGSSVDNIIIHSVYTDLTTGLFYNNANAKKYLSGVMLKKDAKFTFFYNYSKENKLNTANRDFLKKFK